jgi:ABC-type transport system involved in multi-copper enzyme maturation permease subunit
LLLGTAISVGIYTTIMWGSGLAGLLLGLASPAVLLPLYSYLLWQAGLFNSHNYPKLLGPVVATVSCVLQFCAWARFTQPSLKFPRMSRSRYFRLRAGAFARNEFLWHKHLWLALLVATFLFIPLAANLQDHFVIRWGALFFLGILAHTAGTLPVSSEYTANTMHQLLTQPERRNRIWTRKLATVSVGTLIVSAFSIALWWSIDAVSETPDRELSTTCTYFVLNGFTAFCAGPCLAIYLKKPLLSFLASFAFPWLLLMGTFTVSNELAKSQYWFFEHHAQTLRILWWPAVPTAVIIFISLAMLAHSFYAFRRLEV